MRVTFRMIRAARVNSDTASQKRSLEKRRQRRKNSACSEPLLALLCRSSLVLRPSGKYSRIRTYVRHMNCLEKFPKLPPKGLQCLHLRSRAPPIHQSARLSYKKNSKITKTQAIKRPASTGRLRSITLVYSSSRRSPRKFYRGIHRFEPARQTPVEEEQ